MPPRRAPSAPPGPRVSRRLRGLPPSDEFTLYEARQYIHYMNVNVRKKIKYNLAKREDLGEWAYRVDRRNQRQHFFPGQIILAVHAHPQTVLDKAFNDQDVATTHQSPVAAKMRVMVVLHETFTGLLCLPMYTHQSSTPLPPARWAEMVSISHNLTWQGNTRWAGLPLRMTIHNTQYAHDSFIHLTEPIHVQLESRICDVGYMSGGEYCRLMDLLQYKEDELRNQAFALYGGTYDKHALHSWQPTPGQRLNNTRLQSTMNSFAQMRWTLHG